jgi:hypothetical protein
VAALPSRAAGVNGGLRTHSGARPSRVGTSTLPKKPVPAAGAESARENVTSVPTARASGQRGCTLPRSRISRPSRTTRFVTYMRRSVRVDGLPANDTTSPTCSKSRGNPARSSRVRSALSMSQSCSLPSTAFVLIWKRTCGLRQMTLTTSPRPSTMVAASYSAVEWCAESGEPEQARGEAQRPSR